MHYYGILWCDSSSHFDCKITCKSCFVWGFFPERVFRCSLRCFDWIAEKAHCLHWCGLSPLHYEDVEKQVQFLMTFLTILTIFESFQIFWKFLWPDTWDTGYILTIENNIMDNYIVTFEFRVMVTAFAILAMFSKDGWIFVKLTNLFPQSKITSICRKICNALFLELIGRQISKKCVCGMFAAQVFWEDELQDFPRWLFMFKTTLERQEKLRNI